MEGIVNRISDSWEQSEHAAVEAMIDSRKDLYDWASGEDLAEGAIRYFKEHKNVLLTELEKTGA